MRVDGSLVVTPGFVVDADELGWRFSRSSGPGGQGVNTTDSRVELTWVPGASAAVAALAEPVRERLLAAVAGQLVGGALVVVAAEYRSQLRNREAARQRLARRLAAALAPPPARRRGTRPTRGSVERRLRGKRLRSGVKSGRGSRVSWS